MLFKGQITQRKKKPIWIIVILLVFFTLCLVFELKSDNSQETAKLMLRIASKVEEVNRRRDQNVFHATSKNLSVSRNCKQDIFFPIENLL
jgi:hypothetical protein